MIKNAKKIMISSTKKRKHQKSSFNSLTEQIFFLRYPKNVLFFLYPRPIYPNTEKMATMSPILHTVHIVSHYSISREFGTSKRFFNQLRKLKNSISLHEKNEKTFVFSPFFNRRPTATWCLSTSWPQRQRTSLPQPHFRLFNKI